VGREDFVTKIGVGTVIKGTYSGRPRTPVRDPGRDMFSNQGRHGMWTTGWDVGVMQMRVGEKATLDITR